MSAFSGLHCDLIAKLVSHLSLKTFDWTYQLNRAFKSTILNFANVKS